MSIFRLTFLPASPPMFHNYGVVQTSLGVADVACGGEASDGCGVDTAIRFASCSSQFRGYFASSASDDRLVRLLIRKHPPSGDRWVVECGGADAMIAGRRLAKLTSG